MLANVDRPSVMPAVRSAHPAGDGRVGGRRSGVAIERFGELGRSVRWIASADASGRDDVEVEAVLVCRVIVWHHPVSQVGDLGCDHVDDV